MTSAVALAVSIPWTWVAGSLLRDCVRECSRLDAGIFLWFFMFNTVEPFSDIRSKHYRKCRTGVRTVWWVLC